MRLILQLLLLFYSIATFGQAQKTTTVRLSTGDCRSNEALSWRNPDTVTFYKLPEAALVYTIIPRQYRQWPIEIENVPTGNYKLIFENNYGQEVTRQITLTEKPANSIEICPDKLVEYKESVLAQFQDKDTISINFHSQGCFHTDVQKLVITKENDKFIARLYNVSWYYVKKKGKTIMQYRDGAILKTVTMTSQNIEEFTRFENELNYARDGGCTTTDWYDVKSKYLNIKKTDGSCTWNGFYYLSKSLFGEKK